MSWHRIARTVLAFVLFNVGAAIVSWILLPVTRLRLRGLPPDQRRARLQGFYLHVYGFALRGFRGLGLMRFEPPPLPDDFPHGRPFVLIANHPTLIDILLIKATVPGATCLVKASLFRSPHLRNFLLWGGDFPGPRRSEQALGATRVLDTFVERLLGGRPVIVFPEGTRSPAWRLRRFRRGFAEAAVTAHVPILPVFIVSDPPVLVKEQPWWHAGDRCAHMTLEFMPVVETEDQDPRVLTQRLRRDYEARLEAVRPPPGSGSTG